MWIYIFSKTDIEKSYTDIDVIINGYQIFTNVVMIYYVDIKEFKDGYYNSKRRIKDNGYNSIMKKSIRTDALLSHCKSYRVVNLFYNNSLSNALKKDLCQSFLSHYSFKFLCLLNNAKRITIFIFPGKGNGKNSPLRKAN